MGKGHERHKATAAHMGGVVAGGAAIGRKRGRRKKLKTGYTPHPGDVMIKWTSDPSMCWQISEGRYIELDYCNPTSRQQYFRVASNETGRIRWAADPRKCLEP